MAFHLQGSFKNHSGAVQAANVWNSLGPSCRLGWCNYLLQRVPDVEDSFRVAPMATNDNLVFRPSLYLAHGIGEKDACMHADLAATCSMSLFMVLERNPWKKIMTQWCMKKSWISNNSEIHEKNSCMNFFHVHEFFSCAWFFSWTLEIFKSWGADLAGQRADLAGLGADLAGRDFQHHLEQFLGLMPRALVSRVFSSSTLMEGLTLTKTEPGLALPQDDEQLHAELAKLEDWFHYSNILCMS
jgi:hypothetical protein